MLTCGAGALAQAPGTMPVVPQRDTAMNKTNTGKWKDDEPNVTFEKLNSARVYYPDTALSTFHRPPFTQPWYRDLGNLGAPVNNLLFTPEQRVGPTLGYHAYDVYRFNIDSVNYYNTRRPYSVFNYLLGSKLEQTAGILHTQNIRPNWNFCAEYHKTTSPGFYKTQRNNNDNALLTTNYKSLDKHYVLYAAMTYNKQQHDENGGIVYDTMLSTRAYSDRRTINTAFENSAYSINRSSVTNRLRDYTFGLQHSYLWGRTDTTYNSDSTQYTYTLVPRFSITHRMQGSTEKHTYKDLTPDSLRYISLFNESFSNNGPGYTAGQDSVFTQQKWFWIDNRVLLNGYIGKPGRQLAFSAGIGNRYDQFVSQPVTLPVKDSLPPYYYISLDRSSVVSNYITGEVKKEALRAGEWEYGASTRFIFSGANAGDFTLNAVIGKQLKNQLGRFIAGFGQQLGSAPYSYTNYENVYAKLHYTFNKESITTLFATIESPRLRLSGGVKNYVVGNYIYLSEQELPAQYSGAFSITQAWVRKVFKVGHFFLDNELVYQQVPGNAPVNIPALMGKHRLSYEAAVFKKRLKLAGGIEVRYNTEYNPAGYSAILNRFYYQGSRSVANAPEAALFVNFKIKRFRAFLMGDNMQQIFTRNAILFTGSPVTNFAGNGATYTPVYAAPDLLIRFGFNWVMVN